MANCRIVSIILLVTALSVGSAKASTPSSSVGRPSPEPMLNNQRQEAAEDRAEIAFRITKENVLHRYTSALKRCSEQSPSLQGDCIEHARSLYEKSVGEADADFQESHARALTLGTTIR